MKKNLFFIMSLVLVLSSCKKKHETIPPPTPDAAALTRIFDDNTAEATQHFTVNANSFIYIEGKKGTILTLGADQLVDADGNLITGNVDVELIEIDKKSEMIMMNKPTNGLRPDGKVATLTSQGEFYVSIQQNGSEVELLSPMQLRKPFETIDPEMIKFIDVGEDDLLWGIADDSALIVEEDDTAGGFLMGYEILPGEWGWTNIDKFFSDPRPKTTIYVDVPEGFNNENCEVYVSYDGEEGNNLARMDVWEDGRFTEHYGLMPIGLEVHFVAVVSIDGDLQYSIHPEVITEDHVEVIHDFSVISESELIDLIDNLP